MNIRPRTLALVTGLVAAAGALAAPPAPKEFRLGEHGTLVLAIPEGWTAERKAGEGSAHPTFALAPVAGERFEIVVTVLGPGPGGALPDEAAVRREVKDAADSAAGQSVERTLSLEALTGVAVHGFYFHATDRAPRPGEYKYLTQGIARVGAILLAFTVLSNDGRPEVPAAALEMLRGAQHRAQGDTAARAGAT